MLQQFHGRWNTSFSYPPLFPVLPVHISILKICIWNDHIVQKYERLWNATWYTISVLKYKSNKSPLPKLNEAAESEFNLQRMGFINFAGGWITTCTCCPGHRVSYISFDQKKKAKKKGGEKNIKQTSNWIFTNIFSWFVLTLKNVQFKSMILLTVRLLKTQRMARNGCRVFILDVPQHHTLAVERTKPNKKNNKRVSTRLLKQYWLLELRLFCTQL